MNKWIVSAHAIERARERAPGLKGCSDHQVTAAVLLLIAGSVPFGASFGQDRLFLNGETVLVTRRRAVVTVLTLSQWTATAQAKRLVTANGGIYPWAGTR